ncbi:hypothetical protein PVK06_043795 [Gossypium arboreum]|uniref:Uncharacterized protein n=1 Tax=Gossypium arboreum TaxID=29729 RepID=A0ABR0MPE4_GOSAR|nr:hypothetical protein PVK06_043795 [Gossypium arboreum]
MTWANRSLETSLGEAGRLSACILEAILLHWIAIMVKGDIIAGQEAPTVEEEVTEEEEDVCVKVVNEKAEEENTETEAAEKEFVEDIVNASKFMDATNGNLE